MREHADFWRVTNDALDYALTAFGIEDAVLREKLLDLYLALEAYPDARACLEDLSRRGMPTAILSNGTPAMLEAAGAVGGLARAHRRDHLGGGGGDLQARSAGLWTGPGEARPERARASPVRFRQHMGRAGRPAVRLQRRPHRPFRPRDENIPGRPQIVLKSLSEVPDMLA